MASPAIAPASGQDRASPSAGIWTGHRNPPETLYHGTVARCLEAILAAGLTPMARHHGHLSPDVETAADRRTTRSTSPPSHSRRSSLPAPSAAG
ncbi:RNA 2'-phosphotransferase [Sphingomonas azotifigens]|uniref:RNA 2'-phosphotransferase n=1 Tax=Sphingomonas azotifigens TaxID=330920 RepID=UPI001C3FCDCB